LRDQPLLLLVVGDPIFPDRFLDGRLSVGRLDVTDDFGRGVQRIRAILQRYNFSEPVARAVIA